MTEFFRTRMGQQFYDRTVPELVKQLERLNELLERLVRQLDAADQEDRRCHTSAPKPSPRTSRS